MREILFKLLCCQTYDVSVQDSTSLSFMDSFFMLITFSCRNDIFSRQGPVLPSIPDDDYSLGE